MPNIDAVVTATEKLLSPAAPRVLALAGSREPQVEALREAVALDPMLTVRLINHANHSFYARQVPVASVRRALVRLGWRTSRELLVRLLIEGAAQRMPAQAGEKVWHHATRIATLARLVARAGGRVDPELSYTAGLTHSLGVLGLLSLHRDRYAGVVSDAPNGVHLASQERALFGYDHAKVGAGVLERLAVPAPLADAVRWQYHARVATRDWHGQPSLALAGTLQLCHRALAKELDSLPPVEVLAKQPLFPRLGLTLDTAVTLREQYEAETSGDRAAA